MTDRGGKFCKPISNGLYNEQLAFGNLQLALKYYLIKPNSLKIKIISDFF